MDDSRDEGWVSLRGLLSHRVVHIERLDNSVFQFVLGNGEGARSLVILELVDDFLVGDASWLVGLELNLLGLHITLGLSVL